MGERNAGQPVRDALEPRYYGSIAATAVKRLPGYNILTTFNIGVGDDPRGWSRGSPGCLRLGNAEPPPPRRCRPGALVLCPSTLVPRWCLPTPPRPQLRGGSHLPPLRRPDRRCLAPLRRQRPPELSTRPGTRAASHYRRDRL